MNEKRRRGLDAVLAAAAAPPLAREQDELALAAVLATYGAAGDAARAGVGMTEPITPLSPLGSPAPAAPAARRRSRGARLALQAAALFAICAATGITAASTGILPSPVQSFVHHVFGGVGVPGPSPDGTPTSAQSASAKPTAVPGVGPDAAATSPASGPGGVGGTATNGPAASSSPDASEASLETLCGEVQGSGNSWTTTMSAQDQARLIAAAGSRNKVHSYCAHLLRSSGGATPTPSAAGSGGSNAASAPSATPSPTSHGKGKGISKSSAATAGAVTG